MKGSKFNVSDEDKHLFRDAMRISDVKPLKSTPKYSAPKSKISVTSSPRRQHHFEHHVSNQSALIIMDDIMTSVDSETVLSFSREHSRQRLKQLRQGSIPFEARLDLHGLDINTARRSLCEFIQRQSQAHHRCLLIIHGKGGHNNEPPVLKNLVHRWLPQLPVVLAFHSALQKHGGNGAVYVLLKATP